MKYLTEVPKALLGCSMDPISLAVGAAGLIGGLFAGSHSSSGATPAAAPAAAPVAPPAPVATPTAAAPEPPTTSPISAPGGTARKSSQPSFISAAAVPPASSGSGQKSLLGQ